MSLRKLTDSIGIKASGVFIMASQALRSALAKKILTGRYGSAKSRF